MKIKGISESALRFTVESVSNLRYNGNIVFKREPERKGNFLFFTLTVRKSADKGGRRSNTGRKVAAACWHAHRDIMRAIFENYPEAILVSAFARYEGRVDFERTFPATGANNMGSIANPLRMDSACECPEHW